MADEKDKAQKPKKEPKGERQGKKGAGGAAAAAASEPKAEAKPREPEVKVPARLKLRYEQEIRPTLMRELKIENVMRAPRLDKIVINMSLSEARDNVKILDAAVEELKVVTGQKPVITKARKAISNFKLREGMPIGAMVTLRRERMYEFFDRLVNVSLARVRDFRGVSDKSFDGRGNYSLGLREHTIFPELNLDKVEKREGADDDDQHDCATATSRATPCCARWGCRFAGRSSAKPRRGRHRVTRDGEDLSAGKGAAHAQVQDAPAQSLSVVRTLARVLSALQDVPAVPAQVCVARIVARRDQGQLVAAHRRTDGSRNRRIMIDRRKRIDG